MKKKDTCFVVMPFGKKPIADSGGRYYDFDKVYRVIIQRAIKQSGLTPLRADERTGSHIVHAEMFADLRDHPVVLADLSLLNPNVFYELGIRHVMSAAGTVLMCRQGTVLPFDVKLSRVIFYEFDGEALDWETVENVVQRVQAGLENAKRRKPDSPVHALLDSVLSSTENRATGLRNDGPQGLSRGGELVAYQKELAMQWRGSGAKWRQKAIEHSASWFGLRSAAYLALSETPTKRGLLGELPHQLFFLEQYDLANELFEAKKNSEEFSLRDTLRYASSVSEADGSPNGIKTAWRIMQSGLAMIDSKVSPADATPRQAKDAAGAYYCAGTFLAWKWRLTASESDLTQAITYLTKSQRWGECQAAGEAAYPLGQVAYVRLLLLILLRALENDVDRADRERHRETILNLKPSGNQAQESVSYLRWYQVFTLTDLGSDQEALALAYQALAEDARVSGSSIGEPTTTIAGRQYRVLRRFIEINHLLFCNPEQLGRIGQMLQHAST